MAITVQQVDNNCAVLNIAGSPSSFDLFVANLVTGTVTSAVLPANMTAWLQVKLKMLISKSPAAVVAFPAGFLQSLFTFGDSVLTAPTLAVGVVGSVATMTVSAYALPCSLIVSIPYSTSPTISLDQASGAGGGGGGGFTVNRQIIDDPSDVIDSSFDVVLLNIAGSDITLDQPQLTPGTKLGQRLQLFNETGTNTLTMTSGGILELRTGIIRIAIGDSLNLLWTEAAWEETSRDLTLGGSTFGSATVASLVATAGIQTADLLNDNYRTPYGDSSGTPGDAEIDLAAGRSAIAAAASSCVISNNRAIDGMRCFTTVESGDATATGVRANVSAAQILFTVLPEGSMATADFVFGWWLQGGDLS